MEDFDPFDLSILETADETIPVPPMPDYLPYDTYKYDVPVFCDHDGERVTGRLTVTRSPAGWEGKAFFHSRLYMDMDQVSTPRNGGFWHLSHERFLHHIQLVFGFSGRADFQFATSDFEPFFADEEDGPLWVRHGVEEACH